MAQAFVELCRDAGTPLDLARQQVRTALESRDAGRIGRRVTSDDSIKWWPLRDALLAAQAILDDKLSVIEGCIALAAYAPDIVPDWGEDPDSHPLPFCRAEGTGADRVIGMAGVSTMHA